MTSRVSSWFSTPWNSTPWSDLWHGWMGSRRQARREDSMASVAQARVSAVSALAPSQGRCEMRGETAISLHPDARGLELRGLSGRMWVTQEGDPRDHLLVPGKTFRTLGRGLVVVWAVKDGAFTSEPLIDLAGFISQN